MSYRLLLLPFFAVLLLGAADTPLEKEARRLLESGKHADAFALVERGAAVGDPQATSFLAWFYDQGRFVAQDLGKAEALYRNAAARDVAYAQWRLGVMIDEGLAKQGTLSEAVDLFRKAASQNFSNAFVSLGVMQSRGRGLPQDFAAALQNYQSAARLKNVHAFNEIGVVYWQGEGVPADPIEAGAWFVVAAAHDDALAPKYLGQVIDSVGEDALPRMVERANVIGRDYGLLDAPLDISVVRSV